MHVGAILVYDNNDHFPRTTIDSPLLLSVPVLSSTVDMWDPHAPIQLFQHPNKVVSLRLDKRDIFAPGLNTFGFPS